MLVAGAAQLTGLSLANVAIPAVGVASTAETSSRNALPNLAVGVVRTKAIASRAAALVVLADRLAVALRLIGLADPVFVWTALLQQGALLGLSQGQRRTAVGVVQAAGPDALLAGRLHRQLVVQAAAVQTQQRLSAIIEHEAGIAAAAAPFGVGRPGVQTAAR
jgi:hypothetical protein